MLTNYKKELEEQVETKFCPLKALFVFLKRMEAIIKVLGKF
jgi:hypothetical protein